MSSDYLEPFLFLNSTFSLCLMILSYNIDHIDIRDFGEKDAHQFWVHWEFLSLQLDAVASAKHMLPRYYTVREVAAIAVISRRWTQRWKVEWKQKSVVEAGADSQFSISYYWQKQQSLRGYRNSGTCCLGSYPLFSQEGKEIRLRKVMLKKM